MGRRGNRSGRAFPFWNGIPDFFATVCFYDGCFSYNNCNWTDPRQPGMTCSHMVRMLALVLAAVQVSAECVLSPTRTSTWKDSRVRGTIFNVKEGSKGVTFLDFCETFETCPFTVVVFPGDLKYVGDVRQLKGRAIEIKGTVQDYDGRAEIILRHPRQLGKDAALVPPLPKSYDVERRGKYSPGKQTSESGMKQKTGSPARHRGSQRKSVISFW